MNTFTWESPNYLGLGHLNYKTHKTHIAQIRNGTASLVPRERLIFTLQLECSYKVSVFSVHFNRMSINGLPLFHYSKKLLIQAKSSLFFFSLKNVHVSIQ